MRGRRWMKRAVLQTHRYAQIGEEKQFPVRMKLDSSQMPHRVFQSNQVLILTWVKIGKFRDLMICQEQSTYSIFE